MTPPPPSNNNNTDDDDDDNNDMGEEDEFHPSLASFTEADIQAVQDSSGPFDDSFALDNPPPAIAAVEADAQDEAEEDDDDEDDDEGYDEYDDDASTDGRLPPLLLADKADAHECECDDDDDEEEEEMVDMYDDEDDYHGYGIKRGGSGGSGGGGLGYGTMGATGGGGSGFRRSSTCTDNSGSSISDYDDEEMYEFFPPISRYNEWMGRSIEALVLGDLAKAPILSLMEDDDASDDASSAYVAFRRRSTASTFGGEFSHTHRRSSAGSFAAGNRRGSLSLMTPGAGQNGSMHGGTMANYFNRRRPMQPMDVDRSVDRRRSSNAHAPSYRRRSSMACSGQNNNEPPEVEPRAQAGPNIVLSLLARETTGRSKTPFPNMAPTAHALRSMGGDTLFATLDKPAAGIATEVAFLSASVDAGDWAETQMIVSRLAPRLIGDPSATMPPGPDEKKNRWRRDSQTCHPRPRHFMRAEGVWVWSEMPLFRRGAWQP